ncbi:triose-phosphate isomerase [Woeseia oceani]|uniref:Triosephosphate isomerase n=1 Tax=Woeseia oceani TaxID=1548547 RepID=A0A193LG48_9GAMM|nr:triose-phosphate isomerase [Woeseia oceani]ANO51515.1 triose-phosphate isomerase [Woeseia oceani]
MRNFLVAGNWKMNGSRAANAELLGAIRAGVEVGSSAKMLVCPPFPYLTETVAALTGSGIAVGGQNVSEHESGAFTGEVSAAMLQDVGCSHVIVGHSERRALLGETSETVAAKYVAAISQGLTPVLCVGETLQDREAGRTNAVIDAQLNAVLELAGVSTFAGAVVAYEPVWAIGTGETASPQQAQEVHAHIRGLIAAQDAGVAERLQILYGGSVKGDNAAGLFAMPDIDGGLIGGASLKPADFLAIAEAASACN